VKILHATPYNLLSRSIGLRTISNPRQDQKLPGAEAHVAPVVLQTVSPVVATFLGISRAQRTSKCRDDSPNS
jgi:hypothetical protein